ncbi:MAG: low-complexity protein [Proteobacteria bacterium]|nr:low-complexity protein [Pseudomonadota bacterium]
MTLKTSKKSLSIAVGTALGVSLALSPMAFADSSNPFGATELSGGYMQLADGHAGEGKCGGDKAKTEGSCGEGKCGGDKAKTEGSCGEGKCGGDM